MGASSIRWREASFERWRASSRESALDSCLTAAACRQAGTGTTGPHPLRQRSTYLLGDFVKCAREFRCRRSTLLRAFILMLSSSFAT